MRPTTWSRPLAAVAIAMVPCIALCLVGLAVDDRRLVGAPIWLKPLKFAVSILVFTAMWSWLVGQLQQTPRVRRAAGTIAGMLALEYVIIVAQVVRGRQSHFNYSSPLDFALFSLMGVSIVVLTTMNIALTLALMRWRVGDAALTSALRSGAVISIAGLAVGILMVSPRPGQLQEVSDPAFDGILGAHGVGAADGGPGLPLTGWSTEVGDLRVPHFIGMHALEALPLVALLLTLAVPLFPRLADEAVRARVVRLATVGYVGLFAISLWQALRGQSIARPDALTWTALAGLSVVLVMMATMTPLTQPRAVTR